MNKHIECLIKHTLRVLTCVPPIGSHIRNVYVLSDYHNPTTITCKATVGSRCKDQKQLLALIAELIYIASGFDVSDLFPSIKILHHITGMRNRLWRMRTKMDVILDDVISDHQQCRVGGQNTEENEDILDVLLRLKDDGGLEIPLTLDNIKAVILDMFAAGTDTSAVTIEWTMSELMKNPRVMKKVQAEVRHTLEGRKTFTSQILKAWTT
nr:premnaspirodiene oxygenase-like [Tanacetum cinerariifolium]